MKHQCTIKSCFISCVHSYLILTFNMFFCNLLEAYSCEQTLIVQKIVSENNGSDFVFAVEPEAKKELWKVCILVFSHFHCGFIALTFTLCCMCFMFSFIFRGCHLFVLIFEIDVSKPIQFGKLLQWFYLFISSHK